MEVGTIRQQIIDKTLGSFYVFTGEDIAIQNIYIHQIALTKGQEVVRVDHVSEVYGKRSSGFIKKSYCYVCRDDKEFMKSEKAWGTVETALGDNTLILLITQLDKRTKFYNAYKGQIADFAHLPMEMLVRHVKEEISLSDEHIRALVELCEFDYGRLMLEVDKIKTYCRDKFDHSSGFEHLLRIGVIYQPPKDAIFDYTAEMMRGNITKAFNLLDHCKAIGEPPLRLILVLYNNMKKLLQVQSCQSQDISKNTGLSDWDIKCVKPYCGVYSNGELVHALRVLRETEVGLKSGKIDAEVAMDYVMVEILGRFYDR